ncbi:hypothetical protein [Allofournierella massiliensis]|uniref:hypothetical protein n=2 Tax=Allofournierella massiliensis TaxID=1650663 RepID=UPI003564B2E7
MIADKIQPENNSSPAFLRMADMQRLENAKVEYEQGLLEVIKQEVGCDYLSDLHAAYSFMSMRRVLPKIDFHRYSLAECQDALQYICAQSIKISDQSQAKAYLQEFSDNFNVKAPKA